MSDLTTVDRIVITISLLRTYDASSETITYVMIQRGFDPEDVLTAVEKLNVQNIFSPEQWYRITGTRLIGHNPTSVLMDDVETSPESIAAARAFSLPAFNFDPPAWMEEC